jgi:hypothetical protein
VHLVLGSKEGLGRERVHKLDRPSLVALCVGALGVVGSGQQIGLDAVFANARLAKAAIAARDVVVQANLAPGNHEFGRHDVLFGSTRLVWIYTSFNFYTGFIKDITHLGIQTFGHSDIRTFGHSDIA